MVVRVIPVVIKEKIKKFFGIDYRKKERTLWIDEKCYDLLITKISYRVEFIEAYEEKWTSYCRY